MSIYQLLRLLSDGCFHSGSELGERLGLSRTSIWKTLSQLNEFPIELEVVKGKGYRIHGGLDLLDQDKLQALLTADASNCCSLETLLSCTSTNDYMSSKIIDFIDGRYQVCFAEVQSAGRGRRGRAWVSPFAENIYMSVGFKVQGGVEALSGMSLVVGLAVASALTEMGVEDCFVKWPNDVLVGGKKISGVLIELQGEATTGWDVVCGIGLNVSMSKAQGKDIDQDWMALKECLAVDRNTVAAQVLNSLIRYLQDYKHKGFACFADHWRRYDYLYGKELQISPSGVIGLGAGVDAHGALILDVAGEAVLVNAGEASVRRL